MSDLVGNPNCWFSHAQAQIKIFAIKYRFTGSFCYCVCCIVAIGPVATGPVAPVSSGPVAAENKATKS